MKKIFKTFIYAIMTLAAVSLAGCSTDEIDPWTSETGYAWFTNVNTNFTFRDFPDVQRGGTALAAIPITVAGKIADHDRTINVEIASQPKDSRTKIEVQNPVVLHAGNSVDTLWVKVTNTENLDTTPDTVSFRIVGSDSFQPGLKDYQIGNLCLYNGFSQPSWWDSDAVWYIGYFTQLKMQVYVAVTGGSEDPRGEIGTWYSNIAITYLINELNDYIYENDIRYPDDDPNAPGMYPTFDYNCY